MPCYETFMKLFDSKFEEMTDDLKDEFSRAKSVCITADCWSVSCRGFLGVTGHYLNENLERKSYALACSLSSPRY